MPLLLRYHRATGTIVTIWESNSLEVLRAQQVEDDDVHSTVLYQGPLAAGTVEHAYCVREGVVVPQATPDQEKSR